MPAKTSVELRARSVSAEDLEAARMLAFRNGYSHTNSDVVRFAIALAASIQRRLAKEGRIAGLHIPGKGEQSEPVDEGPQGEAEAGEGRARIPAYDLWPAKRVNGVPWPFYLEPAMAHKVGEATDERVEEAAKHHDPRSRSANASTSPSLSCESWD